ncbi:VCBS repeat-containing protein, partial [bacterium]|nr:VCBS repeat-containing protein [bacterium]
MCTKRPIAILALVFLLSLLAEGQAMFLDLGQEEIVQAGGIDIQVDAYSAPCHGDWNGDDLPDLLVGDGGIIYAGTIHLYLNVGVLGNPSFSDAGHIQAGEADLEVPGTACMGAFPRIVFWNEDLLPDLLVGDAYGQVWIFLNEGEDGSPLLGAGSLVQVGPPGGKVPISVYGRATPVFEDWDEDGKRDLVVGAIDGRLHLFLNEGSDTDPDFLAVSYGQATGGDLYVSGGRASPVLLDIDGDGRKELLSGNTLGEMLVYLNIGADASPMLVTYIN